jgi:hypothetical protein
MKHLLIKSLMAILTFAMMLQPVLADSNTQLEERIKKLESQIQDKPSSGLGRISDAVTLFGAIEVDYSYADDADVSDNTAGTSVSDLDLGTVELGVEAQLHEYVTATALLKGEALDSDDRVFWDEVFVEIKPPDFPLYLVAGKRALPFGVFESSFINDPVTCELYEINDTGLTIGYADESMADLDVSVTVYKGETLITNVNDAGYGWSRDNSAGYSESGNVNSYIVSGSVSPLEGLFFSAFYNSEPGDSDRNNTAGAAVRFEFGNLSLDAEYIAALQREKHVADNREYKEKAWTVALGCQVSDRMRLDVRYEAFDADKKQDGNLENRYGAAVTYILFENDSFACNLMGEVRHSEYETVAGGSADDELNEVFARIAVAF